MLLNWGFFYYDLKNFFFKDYILKMKVICHRVLMLDSAGMLLHSIILYKHVSNALFLFDTMLWKKTQTFACLKKKNK